MDTGIKPAPLEAGFSLLEMLVVVTVLAILTVSVGLSFQPTSPDFSFGVPPVPEVVFLPDGQSTPFEITFSALGRYQTCRSDGWSGLTCGS